MRVRYNSQRIHHIEYTLTKLLTANIFVHLYLLSIKTHSHSEGEWREGAHSVGSMRVQ